MKNLILALRLSERIYDDKLWIPRKRGGNGPSDKTYETTTKELNRVMRKYEINTCLRKIHFLSQVYHETDRFYSSQEYDNDSTEFYDPYRGRGILHLTKLDKYENFSLDMKDKEILSNPNILSTNISYIFESGAWFWKKGKNVDARGSTWTYPKIADEKTNKLIMEEIHTVAKNKVSYGEGRERTAIDINELADHDSISTINWLVNGGNYGFNERIKYRNKLKELMNYDTCKDQ